LQQKIPSATNQEEAKMKIAAVELLVAGLALGTSCDLAIAADTGRTGSRTTAKDPGVRSGSDAGGPVTGLGKGERALFDAGQVAFQEADGVGDGLGPRFNLDSCGGCHAQPSLGGTSPAVNPQVAIAKEFGARNKVPAFVTRDGPIVEARFKKASDGSSDGNVHSLFVISGRVDGTGDASSCTAVQENFDAERARGNISLRIPTPLFGAGLVEAIADRTILANLETDRAVKSSLGISGRVNRNPNTGIISRFGWKAQNASLLLFSGEAYNVESGISNELFQSERDGNSSCVYTSVPNDSSEIGTDGAAAVNDIELFTFFAKFLAAPTPSRKSPGGSVSIERGRELFDNVGCSSCHTPSMPTPSYNGSSALQQQSVRLYSDLALHNMGPGLADDISQGDAAGDEFRTAPLWGLGQRLFFLHDGRTDDLAEAIDAHRSAANSNYPASEANQVVGIYRGLSESRKQDLLNFLRSL
jgi:CxxC motif-containing protein (DUF1111 family)